MQMSLVLKALPESFENFVCIENARETPNSFGALKKGLTNYADRRREKEDIPRDVAAFSLNRPPTRPFNKFNGKCHKCGVNGHRAVHCKSSLSAPKKCSNCNKGGHEFKDCWAKGGGSDKSKDNAGFSSDRVKNFFFFIF